VAAVSRVCRTLVPLAFAMAAQHGACQDFVYVEPGVAACPAVPVRTGAVAKKVQRGAAVRGSIGVSCGFEQGSYTVSLNSTDAGATFTPKTFLVNFGRVVGRGAYTVTFSTAGVHGVWAVITSNMGSPAVRGYFAGAVSEFNVVDR
jgi:hypothetical protein